MNFLLAWIIITLFIFAVTIFANFFFFFCFLFQGATLFGGVRRVVPMQHAVVFLTSFVVIVVTKVFLVSCLLYGRLVTIIIGRRVFKCGLQTFAEVLEVMQCPGIHFEVLNLHLLLPLDGDSKL